MLRATRNFNPAVPFESHLFATLLFAREQSYRLVTLLLSYRFKNKIF